MADFNSEIAFTCDDLQSRNPNAKIHYKGKDYNSKIGSLIFSVIIFAFVQFFLIDLKTDIYGEAYARFIANDLVDANFKITNVHGVTKRKKRGRTSKSYTVDIVYSVDGLEYRRTIPGIGNISNIKKMQYRYSKGVPSLGYTDANDVSFYFDLTFLGATVIAVIVCLLMFLSKIIFLKSRVKNNCVINNFAYGGIVKKETNSDLFANYFMTNDGLHYFVTSWEKNVAQEDMSSFNNKRIILYKNNTFTFIK